MAKRKTKTEVAPDYLPVQTCQYIEASYVFKDCPKAWNVFCESNPSCSWGDNNRTMITPDVIIDALECADTEKAEEKECKIVVKRLSKLNKWGEPYIDLEN